MIVADSWLEGIPPSASKQDVGDAKREQAEVVPSKMCPRCGKKNRGDAYWCFACHGRFEA
jgi:hypothetical protein